MKISVSKTCLFVHPKSEILHFKQAIEFAFLHLEVWGGIFQSVDETVVCDHSNESYRAVLSCGTVYYAVQGGSNF